MHARVLILRKILWLASQAGKGLRYYRQRLMRCLWR